MKALFEKSSTATVQRQAFCYLQASVIGTLANFVVRFPIAACAGFEASVVLSTYVGMALVFLLSWHRAFGVQHTDAGMIARFILVSHIGLATVWLMATLALTCMHLVLPFAFQSENAKILADGLSVFLDNHISVLIAEYLPQILEGICHAFGIVMGFFVNFLGHRLYSFAQSSAGSSSNPENVHASVFFAVFIPLAYFVLYAPYGIDTTDFGFFYGHPWRILLGEVPFRDFYYTKPPASLYWHAMWLWITPEHVSVLCGKAGFFAEMLASSWLGTLFLSKVIDFQKLNLPLPLFATAAFVFSVHAFPAMPWHTADGVLAGSAALYCAICGKRRKGDNRKADIFYGMSAGIFAGIDVLVKQSFLFIPVAAFLVALFFHSRLRAGALLAGTCGILSLFAGYMIHAGAWDAFRIQTTGGLSIHEALEAGIFIYLRQDMLLPCLVILYGIGLYVLNLHQKSIPSCCRKSILLQPIHVYFIMLAVSYIHKSLKSQEWIGYGSSWSMFLVVLGGIIVLFPSFFLSPYAKEDEIVPESGKFISSVGFGAALTLAWSTGISGGYKVPIFFSAPLLCSAMLVQNFFQSRTGIFAEKKNYSVLWIILFCGVIMFRFGYETPYVFPVRHMPRSSLVHDAGRIYPRLNGVLVDQESIEILQELRDLRTKYGVNYKTLPGFPLAYFLNGDKPSLPAEWLQDWEINNECEKVYTLLQERDIIVFFERSQLGVIAPDGYARTRYTVPAKVSREWKKIDETEHFVVFRHP